LPRGSSAVRRNAAGGNACPGGELVSLFLPATAGG